jgi:truncated hemoglobin YjbI
MSEFTSAFFGRGAIKATVLAIDPDTMDDQLQKIEAWWKRFFSGIKKRLEYGGHPRQVGGRCGGRGAWNR